MHSLKTLYKIGIGPSSSHTMGPAKIATEILALHPNARIFTVTLFGSLAKTGKGHGTDVVLKQILGEQTEIIFDIEKQDLPHPNTLVVKVTDEKGDIYEYEAYSIGGGDIKFSKNSKIKKSIEDIDVYPEKSFAEVKAYCESHNCRISDYVKIHENGIMDFLLAIWEQMKLSIQEGLHAQGVLGGGLGVERKARHLMGQLHIDESPETPQNRVVCAAAFAVAEQNADNGTIVTAPTCGACGVLPAVLYYMQGKHNFSDEEIAKALAVGGVIGNVIRTNASISGAECGCQAEIGSACSMASASLAELFGMTLDQIEYSAEVAMEHMLGLTCDPVAGLVQIPCIERNAVAAMRAINALSLANFLTYSRKVSFDAIISVMYQTGKDLPGGYRETSDAGMAIIFIDPKK